MTWSNYPRTMTAAARRGIRLNAERGGTCATPVGKETARILSAREPITEDRLVRMYAYLKRARVYYDPDKPNECGTISYLLWGGLPALAWATRTYKQLDRDE